MDTDLARLRPIQVEVERATAAAVAELAGLEKRLGDAREAAAFLFGNELQTAHLSVQEDIVLKEAETTLERGYLRAQYLKRQVLELEKISESLQKIAMPRLGGP